jgi:uncharacterized lipoprotein YajG
LGGTVTRILAALVLASVLAGCAWTDDAVTIPYKASAAAPIAQAGAVTLVVVDGRTSDRDRISTKVNGYGMNMGAVRSTTSVPDVVREAFEAELKQRGFRLDSGGRVITLTINRFYHDFGTGTRIDDVVLAVTVADASGSQLFTRVYKGKDPSPALVYLADGSNAAEFVAAALAEAISKMFADPEFRRSLVAA